MCVQVIFIPVNAVEFNLFGKRCSFDLLYVDYVLCPFVLLGFPFLNLLRILVQIVSVSGR